MSLAVAQKTNVEGFVKPGELVDMRAGADLSLQDRRVFNLLIENAWSEIGEAKTHTIAIAKLRGPHHKGGERVADSVSTLMTTLVEIPATLNGEPAIYKTQLLGPTTQVIDEASPKAMLVYSFPEGLRDIIKDSRYWGRIKAWVMFSFTSKYALALYEAVCLRANLRVDEQVFTVEDFRALLGVEKGQYPGFPQLKQKVLTPAVAEVNALSDFNVEIHPLREGGLMRGKLTGFRLWWERKPAEEWQAVLNELDRPKLGRMARARGTVETISS
ncbi:replication initiation protein [Roseomonas sp. BN140053]|uniref:replication initiation protein n=1 Tax=Roseomonas sp. BN140053 TaxID=3391898 RepID=UPI0039EA177C